MKRQATNVAGVAFVILCLPWRCLAFDWTPPVTNTAVVLAINLDQDSDAGIKYFTHARPEDVDPLQEYFSIVAVLRNYSNARLLRRDSQFVEFRSGDVITLDHVVYTDRFGQGEIPLGGYDATRYWGTMDWYFFDKSLGGAAALYRGKAELFIGFRAHLEDGAHHGWIHFSRPDTHFTTLFRPVAYDWNPIPDAPIQAGLPPEIPLHPEVTPEGLRLHWHPSLAAWILEFREALGGDAPWLPVEGISGEEALLESPAQAGYYRLRRP